MAAVGKSGNLDTKLLKGYLLTHYDIKESWSTRNIIKLYVVLLYLANNILKEDKRQEEWVYLYDLFGPTPINEERKGKLLFRINELIIKIISIITIKYIIKSKKKFDLTYLRKAHKCILIKLGVFTINELNAKEYEELNRIKPWEIVEYVLRFLSEVNFICHGELEIGFSFNFNDIEAEYAEWYYTIRSLETKKSIDEIVLYKGDEYDSKYRKIITTHVKDVNLTMIEMFIKYYSSFILPQKDVEAVLMKKYEEMMSIYEITIANEKIDKINDHDFNYFTPYSIGTLIIQEIKRLVNSAEDLSNAAMPGGNRRKTRNRKNHKARTATKSHKIRHNKTRTKSRR
jgi:hypothetical protein